jgi:hypothetical protein
MSDLLCNKPLKMESRGFLHHPDVVVDPMVANCGGAGSSTKAAAAAGGHHRPAFTGHAGRPYWGHRIDRLIDTNSSVIFTSFNDGRVIVPIPESGEPN